MNELIASSMTHTPALLWAAFLLVFIVLERVLRRGIPWSARWPNLASGATVLLSIFAGAPVIGLLFLGSRQMLGLGPAPIVLDKGYPGASFVGIVAFLFLYDLGYYIFHRFQHTTPWLWRFHAVHHSDTRMNTSTYMRQHVLEYVFQSLLILLPLLLVVQISPMTAMWAAIITAAVQFFVHADLPIHYGPLSRVLLSPMAHRVHHSNQDEQSNSNFSSLFPFWDILFGTYSPPVVVSQTGLHNGERMDDIRSFLCGYSQKKQAVKLKHNNTGLRPAKKLPPASVARAKIW